MPFTPGEVFSNRTPRRHVSTHEIPPPVTPGDVIFGGFTCPSFLSAHRLSHVLDISQVEEFSYVVYRLLDIASNFPTV